MTAVAKGLQSVVTIKNAFPTERKQRILAHLTEEINPTLSPRDEPMRVH